MIRFNYSENHHHYQSSALSPSTTHYHHHSMNDSTKNPLAMKQHLLRNYQKNSMIRSIRNLRNYEIIHVMINWILTMRATRALCEIGSMLSFWFLLYRQHRSFITICAVLLHCHSRGCLLVFSCRPLSKNRRRMLKFESIFCSRAIIL